MELLSRNKIHTDGGPQIKKFAILIVKFGFSLTAPRITTKTEYFIKFY